jgi:hypothetical protein
MKATLEFNLPEDRSEFTLACNGAKYHSAIWDISQEVFRPARKHGYSGNQRLNELLEAPGVSEAIDHLAEIFYRILDEHEVSTDEP